ncbi:N-acetylmuramoyl-L-alanine amidase [Amycolatopsis sp. NPDC049691]|uniref:N-acetylmuramoyl-L-alanine amidase n=1 Tax=Amycolatopsis sp. NPDC049691 TaxID=3155155 RepID=UPI003427A16B
MTTNFPVFSRRTALKGIAATGLVAAGGFDLSIVTAGPASAMPSPGVISCADWGARPARWSSLPVVTSPATKILIHHTTDPNTTDYTRAHAIGLARQIQDFHMDGNGWPDTGQHFTNTRGGYVLEGRHGSLDALHDGHRMIEGAHCPGRNTDSIGIENEGLYTSATPTQAQWDSLVQLCAYVCQQYGISVDDIKGHRDYFATECPGNQLYSMLPKLREDVFAAIDRPGYHLRSTFNDNYVAAELGWTSPADMTTRYGMLRARTSGNPGIWETYTRIGLGDRKVAFRAYNGKYVSAELGWTSPADMTTRYGMLRARADKIGPWEQFTLEHHGSYTAYKAANGKYVSAEFGWTSPTDMTTRYGMLRARADRVDVWEKFAS